MFQANWKLSGAFKSWQLHLRMKHTLARVPCTIENFDSGNYWKILSRAIQIHSFDLADSLKEAGRLQLTDLLPSWKPTESQLEANWPSFGSKFQLESLHWKVSV